MHSCSVWPQAAPACALPCLRAAGRGKVCEGERLGCTCLCGGGGGITSLRTGTGSALRRRRGAGGYRLAVLFAMVVAVPAAQQLPPVKVKGRRCCWAGGSPRPVAAGSLPGGRRGQQQRQCRARFGGKVSASMADTEETVSVCELPSVSACGGGGCCV